MTPSDQMARKNRRESTLAFSIIFFAFGVLCFLLGGAEGVRHGTKILHIPETGGWLVAAGAFASLGVFFLLRSRRSRPSES